MKNNVIKAVKLLFIVALLSAAWFGYDRYPVYKAMTAVESRLIDPDSARWRYVRKEGIGVCGEVSSRNRFGGMSEFVKFFAMTEVSPADVSFDQEGSDIVTTFCPN